MKKETSQKPYQVSSENLTNIRLLILHLIDLETSISRCIPSINLKQFLALTAIIRDLLLIVTSKQFKTPIHLFKYVNEIHNRYLLFEIAFFFKYNSQNQPLVHTQVENIDNYFHELLFLIKPDPALVYQETADSKL